MHTCRVSDMERLVGEIAPYELAEEWDNVGLLVGRAGAEVSRVLVALDLTDGVVKEAKALGAELIVTRPSDAKNHRAMHGLYRSLINNMVVGVTKGYEKSLELVGVGYRAQAESAKKLVINIGFSHPVEVDAPENVSFATPSQT